MGKKTPQERARGLVYERVEALKLTPELKVLRKKGLSIFGRRKMYSAEEWWSDFSRRARMPEFLEYAEECRQLGNCYGIASYVVVKLCLVRGYKPEKQLNFISVEADPPRIRLVTESTDPFFLTRLAWEAQQRGLALIQQQGSAEIVWIVPAGEPVPAIESISKPPDATAFRMRVEVPTGYPPEAAKALQKRASDQEREIREAMGYHVRKRVRNSTLTSKAKKLKVNKSPLPSGGIYKIADKIHGEFGGDDPRIRNVVKSSRHRGRKRFIDHYKPEN